MDMTPTSNINRVEIFMLQRPLALKNTFVVRHSMYQRHVPASFLLLHKQLGWGPALGEHLAGWTTGPLGTRLGAKADSAQAGTAAATPAVALSWAGTRIPCALVRQAISCCASSPQAWVSWA
jgi:hypothetical protein